MPKKHRYTGENPPVEVLAKFPNWVNAYDEEGELGQDETTLKPDFIDTHVTRDTAFTAVTLHLLMAPPIPCLSKPLI
jgi:hypothetical protein